LLLRGFTYETLENDRIGVRDRLRWLERDKERGKERYAPQTYNQLAACYRRGGDTKAARRVGIAKEWRRRSRFSPLNWLLYATVGYGYRTWLAAIWLAVLAFLGTRVFTVAYAHHLMRHGANPPAFHPVGYALDLLVPVVNLGQRNAWTPGGWAVYWSWAMIAAGWVLTTAVVAGLTGILKRD
jgi:hypothetical protein